MAYVKRTTAEIENLAKYTRMPVSVKTSFKDVIEGVNDHEDRIDALESDESNAMVLVDGATEDNLLSVDDTGQAQDSGIAKEDVATAISEASTALQIGDVNAGAVARPSAIDAQFLLPIVIRKEFAAGETGAADDVQIIPVDGLPFEFAVMKVFGNITAGQDAGRTITLYTRAGGAGTALTGGMDCSEGGQILEDGIVANLATPGGTEGLFARRSHDALAGNLLIVVTKTPVP